jgi:hypothetical protein
MKARKPTTEGREPPTSASRKPWSLRLAILKRYGRRAANARKEERRFTNRQFQLAELVLKEIIDGGDVLCHVEQGVAILVTLSAGRFNQLCELGAEMEDDEEQSEDEGAQCEGEGESADQDDEPNGDSEPSLASWAQSITGENVDREDGIGPSAATVEAAKARVREREAAGLPEDGPQTIRNGKGEPVVTQGRWGSVTWGAPIRVRGRLVNP